MWLSKQTVRQPEREKDGALAMVSIGGTQSAAVSGSEQRDLSCVRPKGLVWLPEQDDTVVTLDLAGGKTVILGALDREVPEGMQPGEVYLYAGDTAIHLRRNGTVTIRGTVDVDGTLTVNGKGVLVSEN